MNNINLEVRKRGSDYHVQLVEQPAIWECGKTPEEAIGKWFMTHGRDFGTYITIRP